MSIWTASASCRSRMRRGLGAGWPACPFALGRGGGRCAGTCGGEQCPRSSAEEPPVCGGPPAAPGATAPAGRLCAFVLSSDLENLNSAFLPGLPTASPLGREGLFPREWPRGDPAGTRRRLRRGRQPRRGAVAASGEPCCCSPGDWRSPRVCRGRLDREARPLAQARARRAGSPPPGLPHPEPQACPR